LEIKLRLCSKKPFEDGFQSLRNYKKWKIWKILHKITSKSQGDVLEKNVETLFMELDVEFMKNTKNISPH
jgi:hypothetical protein